MTLNAVLCGCGAMAKGWLRAIASHPDLQSSIRICGLVDLNENVAHALADRLVADGRRVQVLDGDAVRLEGGRDD